MTLIAVKNASSSKSKYGWIARDLGNLFPDVLAVKLFNSKCTTFSNCNEYVFDIGTSAVRQIALPTVSDYSTIDGATPFGFLRVCHPTTGIYSRYCVISIAYDVNIFVHPDPAKLPEAKTETGFERQYPPWNHVHFQVPRDSNTFIDNTLDQDMVDIVINQPNARVQVVPGWANGIHPGDPGSSYAAYIPIEPRRVRWRGVMWPHRVLGIPFTTYISEGSVGWRAYNSDWALDSLNSAQASFTGAAFGHKNPGDTASATYHRLYVSVATCATFLFKTLNAGLT